MARDFDGTNDVVDFGDSTEFEPGSSNYSCFIWYDPDDFVNYNVLMSKLDTSEAEWQFYLNITDGFLSASTSPDGSSNKILTATSNALSSNTLYAVGLSKASTVGTFYVDGSSTTDDGTALDGTLYTGTAKCMVGARGDLNAVIFADGVIAHAAFWKTELSANEHAILSRGVNPFVVNNTNLKLYAPLGGNESPESNYANPSLTGTLTGTTKATTSPPVEHLENYL